MLDQKQMICDVGLVPGAKTFASRTLTGGAPVANGVLGAALAVVRRDTSSLVARMSDPVTAGVLSGVFGITFQDYLRVEPRASPC